MDAFIAMTEEERRRFCKEAEDRTGLSPASVEKDFWVCWTLKQLFTLPNWGSHLTFKGGTALSKGWKLIERFSEDIDIVIDREALGFGGTKSPEKAPSKKQRRVRLEALKGECQKQIHEGMKPALEERMRQAIPNDTKWRLIPATPEEDTDGQTLLFEYPGTLTGTAIYLRPIVKYTSTGPGWITPQSVVERFASFHSKARWSNGATTMRPCARKCFSVRSRNLTR
jgi:hypothetical protein